MFYRHQEIKIVSLCSYHLCDSENLFEIIDCIVFDSKYALEYSKNYFLCPAKNEHSVFLHLEDFNKIMARNRTYHKSICKF